MDMTVPTTSPHRIGADTWLIPNIFATGPGTYLPVNSMLIRGPEPIVVDTGAPVHREHWFDQVSSLVDRGDVRSVSVENLGLAAVASAHGPVLSGSAIADAFDGVRAMAPNPIVVPPGQPLLDEMVAAALAGAER